MFNIFKKRVEIRKKPKTILCIPGNWQDRSEIITSIAKNNINEFLFAGQLIVNLKTNETFELEICERDDKVRDAFKIAGLVNQLSDSFLNEIDTHKYVIYIIGETGDLDKALSIAQFGNAILKAGGLGVKVESTGKAFTKEQWMELLKGDRDIFLYKMFVIDSINDGKGTTYSCGMHNIGFKDTIISNEEFQSSVNLISIFSYYQIIDNPLINNNQTFSASKESPMFKIIEESNQPYKGDELFENTYGMWRLKRV